MVRLVKNFEAHYEFIRMLRTHPENTNGFLEQVEITPEQQKAYMSKYGDGYYILLADEVPVGYVGVVDNDIRVCTHPDHKGKGYGKIMVKEIIRRYPDSTAKVLLDNEASHKLFLSAGYKEFKRDDKFIYYNMKYRKPLHNPYKVVKMFEEEVASYTNAPYAVSVDSCTNALFLCLMYTRHKYGDNLPTNEIRLPSKTYLSVPQSIIHSGFEPVFDTSLNNWVGLYKLEPYDIYDSAKRLTSDMYIPNSLMCLSFHIKKTLSIGKGGMILTDDAEAVEWFKQARYEGRSEKLYHEDDIKMLGWNMYMTPQEASHGLALMQNYPLNVPDLGENNGYRDLTEFTVFKNYKKI